MTSGAGWVLAAAVLVASLRALWLWISGALSTPPPLVDGRRVFRADRVYILAIGAAFAAASFALAWDYFALAKPMEAGVLLAMPFFAVVAVLAVMGTTTRIILDPDTITSKLPLRPPRSEALDDMTAVRGRRIKVRTRRGSHTMIHRIVRMRGKAWLLIPAMMPGDRWLFAHLQARLATNAALTKDA